MWRLTSGLCAGIAVAATLAGGVGAVKAAEPSAPTFTRDIAPIFLEKCQDCHRKGQMAPMSLVTYEEVRPYARGIRQKVVSRAMPPWHLDDTVGIQSFKNDRSLSRAQIDTIARWVDAGAPQGNPADMPAAKDWPRDDVWRLNDVYNRPPDLIVKSTPWTQAAQGQDQWWQPVVDTGLTEDRWVQGIEIRPSMIGRQVVHHVVSNLVQNEDNYGAVEVPGGGGYFSEFAVGKIGDVFRENTGKLMKAGSKIRFDIHYHSVGKEITDSSEIAVWFYPKGVTPKYRVFPQAMGVQDSMRTLDLPPGTATTHDAYVTLPEPARLENFQPHMHVRGKAMSMEAIYPDGRVEMLSYVNRFEFNWHVNYVYADDAAPVLPKGTIIKIKAWHDNTAANRSNPDPTQWVGWGQRSFDDMYHAHVNVTYLTQEDYDKIVADRKKAKAAAVVSRLQ
ncbi:MAG: hypothetical protein ABL971_01065 [Vicinamibacterales bacterium]